ncbi:MAG TPA: hypothetical protein VF228_17910 [Iamia sp.]
MTSLGRETVGRRMRRRILGAAAPGMEVDSISFDLEDIVLWLLGWMLKIVLILLVVPVVLVVVLLVGLVELLGRLVLRRPWSIDAFGRDGSHVRWPESGMRRARVRRDEIRVALAAGAAPQGGDVRSGPDRS